MENQEQDQKNAASTEEQVITYPTPQDADGWFYENEGQHALEIETRVDAEENIFKRIQLTKKRVAIMRELNNKETKTAAVMAKNKQDKLLNAYIAMSTTVTDAAGNKVSFVMEDLDMWKGKDTNRLDVACQNINF